MIELYKNYYVTEEGFVYSLKSKKYLKNVLNTHRGYYKVSLMLSEGKRDIEVHRLVALAFIPNPENKPQVNHKDGNKLNNHVSNLEWVTDSENKSHGWTTGLYKSSINQRKAASITGSKTCRLRHESNKKKVLWTHSIEGSFYGSASELITNYSHLKLSKSCLSSLLNNKIKSYRGWIIGDSES